jgi:hypothetical protein
LLSKDSVAARRSLQLNLEPVRQYHHHLTLIIGDAFPLGHTSFQQKIRQEKGKNSHYEHTQHEVDVIM